MTWNPKRWNWEDLDKSISKIRADKHIKERWSCGVNRSIQPGDRVFLIKLGSERPKGIIASGWVVSPVFEDRHWDSRLAKEGKQAHFVEIDLDMLLNPYTEDILDRSELDRGVLSEMHWNSQSSGVRIPNNVARELERKWTQFLHSKGDPYKTVSEEELADQATFMEGASRRVTMNVYERNPEAREECLRHYGHDCSICGFNFSNSFGKIGANFIHVHHLKPLSQIGQSYKLNPITDMRPVCPNCHAMIHKKTPAYSIEEIRKIMKRQ